MRSSVICSCFPRSIFLALKYLALKRHGTVISAKRGPLTEQKWPSHASVSFGVDSLILLGVKAAVAASDKAATDDDDGEKE